MSRQRQLDERLASLDEVREIMSSLKTLAFLETHKLARYTEAQQRAFACIDAASADLAAHFPVADWQPDCRSRALVVLGSERGFCGKYNETLEQAARAAVAAARGPFTVIAVGQKLASRWPTAGEIIGVDGASVAEEVQTVLLRVADVLAGLQARGGPVALDVMYQDPGTRQVVTQPLFPVLAPAAARRVGASAPQLNVEPQAMFAALLEERLYASLLAACYDALTAENHQRMEHLDGAVRHLDRQCEEMRLKRNYLRQEEITEEIEAILQSAEATAGA